MKIARKRRLGFTLVEIMIVVAIIGLLAAIAVPNFVHARGTSQANACINNLRQIDSATQQWALERGKLDTEEAVPEEVKMYLRDGKIPTCPTGPDYVFAATLGTSPNISCPVGATATPGHSLP
jgi:prepilin-type N-terminal cleavage/methylation domain-containing protein